MPEKQKKIFIPGGKFDDLFLIEAAHKFGFYVITSGTEKDGIAHKSAEKYIYADSSDIEAMLKIAKDENIDYMCSCAHDFGYISTAYVCEKLGLPGHDSYETALTIHKKDKFKKLAREIGLSIPGGDSFEDSASALEYLKTHFEGSTQKLIMKPVDSCAGRGITEVESFAECEEAVKNAFDGSRLKRIVIEPYINGQLHDASVFIVNQKVVFCYIVEGFIAASHKVRSSISPAKDKKEIEAQLIREFEKVAHALNLVDGKIHTNFMVDDSGNIYILEMHRRCSGDTYSKFIESATGIHWNEWIVKSECGMNVKDFPRKVEQQGYHMFVVPMAKHNGVYRNTIINEKIKPYIHYSYFYYKNGDLIKDFRWATIGLINLELSSYEAMRDIAENPDKYFTVIVE